MFILQSLGPTLGKKTGKGTNPNPKVTSINISTRRFPDWLGKEASSEREKSFVSHLQEKTTDSTVEEQIPRQ